jgi:uncharacterized protein (TIGR02453 family)
MAHFSPALFRFLKDLKRNNRREWFAVEKPRWERDVRAPLLAFIEAFAPELKKISPQFRADGKSMFRIYRDTRFSKDKSPFKLMASAHFRHARGGDVHAPGFYLHLEPGQCFGGFGLWHPDGPALEKIRGAILERPAAWKKATARLALGGESLKRPPRGVDPEHPLVADLKRKDFIVSEEFSEREICKEGFHRRFVAACRRGAPLVKFLTEAVGLPF